jgi:hypothetical protein
MSFLSGLKNILTAPTKLLTKPIQKTIGSSKKLFRGDIRGAGSELNPLSRANRSGALGDLKGLALPWRGGSSPMPGAPPPMAGAPPPPPPGQEMAMQGGGQNLAALAAGMAGGFQKPMAPPDQGMATQEGGGNSPFGGMAGALAGLAGKMGGPGPGMMSPINMGMKRRPNPEDDYPPY